MFKRAIVRRPGRSLVSGITTASLGKPDYPTALRQHDAYIQALEKCGVRVTVLDAAEDFPDSVFVEDTAVLTEKCAVITRPGAASRQGEEVSIHECLKEFYDHILLIKAPGTIEGGDVMRVGNHFYAGLSARTNEAGTHQLSTFLENYGYTQSDVHMSEMLHLKTGLAYLENNVLLVAGEFVHRREFNLFNRIIIPKEESYAANCIWVNDFVLVPLGFPQTKEAIETAGYHVLEVDVSEFRKLDGGLSCLSLRF